MSAFEELGVMPEIIQAVEDMDWLLPTPVQTEAIPLILGGGDVSVAAETGSGKTGAFSLPVVQIIYETRRTNLSKSTTPVDTSEEQNRPISLSQIDRGRLVAVNPEGTIAQCRNLAVWEGVRATKAVASGKWYYVAIVRDEGLCRVGWSSKYAQLILGTDSRGFGYGATAMKSHDGKFDAYGEKYARGDQICCMVEFDYPPDDLANATVTISFLKNDLELGVAFSEKLSSIGIENIALFPAISFKNAEMFVDFSVRSEKAEELGFKSMSTATKNDAEIDEMIRDKLINLEKDKPATSEAVGEKKKAPLALILEPSRELASQVNEELSKFSKYLEYGTVRKLLLIGGGNPKAEKAILRTGLDVIAGTLGSVVGHVKKGTLSLENIRFFILDEADTFATDNMKDILFLHQKIPIRNNVQTLLFSATLHSPEIKALSERIQNFPTWVDLKGKESVPDTVHHTMVRLDADADTALLQDYPNSFEWPLDKVHDAHVGDTMRKVKTRSTGSAGDTEMTDAADERSQTMKKLKLAALRKVIDAHNMNQAMIFARTQQDCDNVESFLIQCSGVSAEGVNTRRFRGRRDSGPETEYSCAVLHGGKRQEERNAGLAAFKASEVRFLVCTDVAARGIDIAGLPYLVNVSLPDKSENYLHRVGRVGRAERLGLAVSLVSDQKEAVWYHTCNKARGGVCKNRKLISVGGCVMWQNESKMLAEIEERLKGSIEELNASYRRKNMNAGPRLYGSKIGEMEVSKETAERIKQLQPSVQKLVKMEEDAQYSFFAMQQYTITQ